MINTTLTLDDESHKASKNIRAFSTSALLRWLLKALTTDEKAWDRLIVRDPEIRAVQEWIRPKLLRALNMK
jgi:hypothetical protein